MPLGLALMGVAGCSRARLWRNGKSAACVGAEEVVLWEEEGKLAELADEDARRDGEVELARRKAAMREDDSIASCASAARAAATLFVSSALAFACCSISRCWAMRAVYSSWMWAASLNRDVSDKGQQGGSCGMKTLPPHSRVIVLLSGLKAPQHRQ